MSDDATPDPVDAARAALPGWTVERVDEGGTYRTRAGDVLAIRAPIPSLGRRMFGVVAAVLTVVVGAAIASTRYVPFLLVGVPAAVVGVIGTIRAARDVLAPRVLLAIAASRRGTDVTDAGGSRRVAALERVIVVERRVSGGVVEATVLGLVAREEVLALGPIPPSEARAIASAVAEHLGLVACDDDTWARPVA